MKETINRRRFVAFAGAGSLVGTAGCLGGGDQRPGDGNGDSDGTNEGNGGNDDGDSGDQTEEKQQEQNDEQGEAFDFPPGANENGIFKETVVAGGRQFLEETGR